MSSSVAALVFAAAVVTTAALSPAGNLEHGDQVYFTVPRTDRRLTVEDIGHVHTFWDHYGHWQRLVLQRMEGSGEILDGSYVYLYSWLGKYVGRQGVAVTAVSEEMGEKQEFTIRSAAGDGGPIKPGSTISLWTHDGHPVVVDDIERPGYVTVGDNEDPASYNLIVDTVHGQTTPTRTPGSTEASTTMEATTEAPTEPPTTTMADTQVPTTEAPTEPPTPTTEAPTTEAPTTEAPTTEAPTTEAPTTEAPTTEAPTTEAPTTEAPTTQAPTTEAPTTEAPTTEAPTTQPPTTEAPTTEAPTTEAPTTEAPTTTTAAMPEGGPMCADLDAAGLAAALMVKTVELPAPLRSGCSGFGIRPSCRHGFYASTPVGDGASALLYNDAEGHAIVVLFDGQGAVGGSKVVGTEEARGLQFDPSGEHLVALVSGGTNIEGTPSLFVKLAVPSLEILWTKPVESPMVGMEKWTPDNADAFAISGDRLVLHSAGVCKEGQWCAGHQGDITQVVDAMTGEQITSEGRDWRASHSCKQMIGYNAASDTFLMANAADYYPKALQFFSFSKGTHGDAEAEFPGWGDGGGRQGVTQGAIKADPSSEGFASVWSYGEESGAPDKLYFATISKDATFVQEPKQLFPDAPGTEIGANLAPLGAGKWLVAYTTAESDVIGDYLRIYWDNWSVPDEVRASGARLAVIDGSGNVLGEPIDVAALGAPFPVELNHLVERADGLGWIHLDGPGLATAKIAHLKCRRAGTATPEAPATPPCERKCDIDGQTATCAGRISWSSANTFAGQPSSCQKAHDLVKEQCGGVCDECEMECAEAGRKLDVRESSQATRLI